MTLKECYEILRLDQSASLDEIKHAYRRRAFELHPDLNPGVADAGQRFQQLNEAYVILSKIVALREQKQGAKQSSDRSSDAQGQTGARQSARADSEEARREKGASEQAPPSSGAGSTADSANATQDSAKGAASASGPETVRSENAREKSEFHERTQGAKKGEEVYAEQQEVLKDILNDAFARRVFEDIYSEIRKKTSPNQEKAERKEEPKARAVTADVPAFAGLKRLGRGNKAIDFSRNIGGSLKNWLRGQIDEEQVFELPARRLAPGAKIRLQIRRGLSDEVTTLDVTLPPDFHPDKPIRLKGMGKKLGRWQGDLYLRFSSKD